MKRLFAVVAVTAVFSGSVLGQAPAPRPAFDVAGIQISTRPQPGMRGGQLRGNRYEIRNATMVDLIRTAYNVQPEKIGGGPSWLEWNRFDIAALAPEKTSPDRLRDRECRRPEWETAQPRWSRGARRDAASAARGPR